MALSFLENKLNFINDPSLIDDISGTPGAVEFISENEKYCLERRTLMRLISYNLQRHEHRILVGKYGKNNFMLRNDVYWYDDTDSQSLLDFLE
jgi:hypothetical protein